MSASSPFVARSRVLSRAISLAFKPPSKKPSIPSEFSPSLSHPVRRSSILSRLPVASSCLMTMLPLHSAIASARLRSELSAESQSWGWIPQGLAMPL
ncbi:protein NUCLEAR FUSION DEFECTIVE 6, chloroplastic/mitochondrial-like [Asparagus officinalis]|uniref:protein NUCLEAR FUSION DEFECTIVE 6, chloroplastic/mitochondrial-like n=1 Tax=Asparagus officinalis TaxID=4686 RepID=UPI00098DF442|nr:protein NUCLEAR FUSION DEFECTIVE 6, chloroplastic/mitochondrial-like [Asparagus officinalis]